MGSALSDACKVPVYIQAEKMRTRKYGKAEKIWKIRTRKLRIQTFFTH